MSYCTVTDVKTYLNTTTAGDDLLIGDLIDSAQGAIDNYTHRTFEAAADATHYFDDDNLDGDGDTLILDGDLCAITSITNGDGDTVTTSDYKTEPRNSTPYNALIMRGTSSLAWDGSTADISIVGRWSYSTGAPASVKQACIRLTAFMYRQRDTSTDIDRPLVTDSGVTILPSALPNDVTQLLTPLVRY